MKCPNCGADEPHFVPPCFGDKGFYICDKPEQLTANLATLRASNELQTQNFIDEREVHGHTKLRKMELQSEVATLRRQLEAAVKDENHCVDCCCARSWKALGIDNYTGKSIPEEITTLRQQLNKAVEIMKTHHHTMDSRVIQECQCKFCKFVRYIDALASREEGDA